MRQTQSPFQSGHQAVEVHSYAVREYQQTQRTGIYVRLNGVSDRVEGLRFDAQGWFPWLVDVTVAR